MIKVILDTNVLVSGLISPKSYPAKIIDLWQKRKFTLITSEEILNEYQKVLSYPKIKKVYHLDKMKIEEYLKGLSIFSQVCKPTKKVSLIKDDPADNKFLEAAVSAAADFIVSGDSHLLCLDNLQGLKIVTPKAFWEESVKIP